jgi:hypothetical protein
MMAFMKIIHSLRLVSSFALLGAVIMGVFTGSLDHQVVDFRVIGAIMGALGGIAWQTYEKL